MNKRFRKSVFPRRCERTPLRSILPSILTLAFFLLAGASPGPATDEAPASQQPNEPAGFSEGLVIPLQVPLASPLFSDTPLAVMGDDLITVRDLTRSISSTHAGRAEQETSVEPNYRNLLERLITTRLIVQEARNIGLDELPRIRAEIAQFERTLLISTLVKQHLRQVDADASQVDELYQTMSREFLLTTLVFSTEQDALSFQEDYRSSRDFGAAATRFIEEGKAKGEIGGQQYLRLKDLLPQVAQLASEMSVDTVSPILQGPEGLLLFHVEDIRFYEDPTLKEEARQQILDPLRKEKAREYAAFLEAKHATINEKLLEKISFESSETGVLWFQKKTLVDFDALLADTRVLATVHGQDPVTITVGDVAREVKKSLFHGIEKALEKRKELDRKKHTALHNILFEKTAELEAVSQGINKSPEYLNAIEEHTNSVLFDAFIKRVVAPDVKISEEEIREYYDQHLDDFSTPTMLRMNGLVFHVLADAKNALDKLRRRADFRWVSANTPGQVDKETEGIFVFDDALVSLTALPEGLRDLAEDARQGDAFLYSSPDNYHYVIAVSDLFPPTPEAYEKARKSVAEILFNQKVKNLVQSWGVKLREAYETRSFVRGFDDPLANGRDQEVYR